MTNDIVVSDWYESLVTDCKAIMTEAVFNSRWALVEGYHALGERIANDKQFVKHAKGNETSLTALSGKLGMSSRNLYRALSFYDKFPDINTLPQGKNISWNKIVTELLPANVTETEEKRCLTCGRKY